RMLGAELKGVRDRVDALTQSIAADEQRLDDEVRQLEGAREQVRLADDEASRLRTTAEEYEARIKGARAELDTERLSVSDLDIARATAESDLAHLAAACIENLQAALDDVLVEVDEAERQGKVAPDVRAVPAEDGEDAE